MHIINIFLSIFKSRDEEMLRDMIAHLDDPLSHPDILKMDQRALGDLPMPVLPPRDRAPKNHTVTLKLRMPRPAPVERVRECDQV